jgi:hypothetical protein
MTGEVEGDLLELGVALLFCVGGEDFHGRGHPRQGTGSPLS